MKRILPLFVALSGAPIMLVTAQPASAQQGATNLVMDPAAGGLLAKSEYTYAALEGLSVRFDAINTVDNVATKSSGKISYAKPGKVRFEINSDAGVSTVVSDGEKVAEQLPAAPRVYKPIDLGGHPTFDVVTSRTGAVMAFPLLSLLQGNRYMAMGYDWQSATASPDGGVKLEGTTAAGAPIIMALHFDPASNLVSSAEIATTAQGKTVQSEITFYDTQSNPDFGDGAFSLAAPPRPSINPDTNALLAKAISAYKALPSFSTHFETVQTADGATTTSSGDVTLGGPDKIRLEMKTKDGDLTSVTDGQTVWQQNTPAYYIEKDAKEVGGAQAALGALQMATNSPIPDIIMGQGMAKCRFTSKALSRLGIMASSSPAPKERRRSNSP